MRTLLRTLHGPIYAKRLQVLTTLLDEHLPKNASFLDIGCGSGLLGQALSKRRPDLRVEGLEKHPRGGEPIQVHAYNGISIPFNDQAFDSVLLADVLHHEAEPAHLLREAARVAKKTVIIKDHVLHGLLAWPRVAFIDWAANAGYGVRCLYRYHSRQGWRSFVQDCGLELVSVQEDINLYPPGFNLMFGRKLQWFGVLQTKNQ